MGIKHFYGWFRHNEYFKHSVNKTPPPHIDHLLIDMNGIIHEAAQKTYKYGRYEASESIVLPQRVQNMQILKTPPFHDHKEQLLFDGVKKEVNEIIKIACPQKTVFLAIDGVAPKSKQNQQRQRRYKAAKEKTKPGFDSANITAGTGFMKRLTSALTPLSWINVNSSIETILSSDEIPGEGEHKLIGWIRSRFLKNNNEYIKDIYTVVGVDADLILLCLCLLTRSSSKDNSKIFIMRHNNYFHHDWIDINHVYNKLIELNIPPEDLVVWSCFIGNDFLPPIPTLEIKESPPEIGALDFFFNEHGAQKLVSGGYLNLIEIKRLLEKVSYREQAIMDARKLEECPQISSQEWQGRFPNNLWSGDINNYRDLYFKTKLANTSTDPGVSREKAAYMFMKTVYWVYKYYTVGVPDWEWFYPYNYALHASEMVTVIDQLYSLNGSPTQPSTTLGENLLYEFSNDTQPCHPNDQLLYVIPYESKLVVSPCLWEKMEKLNKNLYFTIDIAGKRQLWEATVLIKSS